MAWTRLLIYVLGLAASALAVAGLADFNPATGDFQPYGFNIYAVAGGVAGAGNGLALIAWLTGAVGRKR